jgi:hypothetical protein
VQTSRTEKQLSGFVFHLSISAGCSIMFAHPMQTKIMQGTHNSLADLESAFDNPKLQTPAPAPTSGPRVYNNRPQVNRPRHEHPAAKTAGAQIRHPARPIATFKREPATPPQPPRMKILVAIPLPQVKTKLETDFMDVEDGELLYCPDIPNGAFADDDDGLARSFVGVETHNSTTVAQVREATWLTAAKFTEKVKAHLLSVKPDMAINYEKLAKKLADRTLAVAAKYRVNEVIQYRDGRDSIR